MSVETQNSKTELLSTSMKTENECILTCTTGFPPQTPSRLKSILKNEQSSPVESSSRKELEWSDSRGLQLHEIREYIVSEREDDLIDDKREYQLTRRPSCCLMM
eukprot:g8846.t1